MLKAYRAQSKGDIEPDLLAARARFGTSTKQVSRERAHREKLRNSGIDLEAYTADLNRSTILKMSPGARALPTPRLVARVLPVHAGGNIGSSRNRKFVCDFIRVVVPENERQEMLDAHGILTPTGKRRIETAVITAAYDRPEIIDNLVRSWDDDMKNIGLALKAAAGPWAIIRMEAQSGVNSTGVDVTSNLIEAGNIVQKAYSFGGGIYDLAMQMDLFKDDIEQHTIEFLKIFFGGYRFTHSRSASVIENSLLDYVGTAKRERPSNTGTSACRSDAKIFSELKDRQQQAERWEPELLRSGAKLAALYIRLGAISFKTYATAIIEGLRWVHVDPAEVKAVIKAFYGANLVQVDDATFDQMDNAVAVRAFNLDVLDNDAPAEASTMPINRDTTGRPEPWGRS